VRLRRRGHHEHPHCLRRPPGAPFLPPLSPRPRPSPFHPPGVSRAAGSLLICRVSLSPRRRICHCARRARSGFACLPSHFAAAIKCESGGESVCALVCAAWSWHMTSPDIYYLLYMPPLHLHFLAASINRSSRNFRFTQRPHANPRLCGTNHATS
jgi:hypothetical protein